MSTSQQCTLCDKTPRKYPYHHLRIGLIYTATGIDHYRSTAWYICFSPFPTPGTLMPSVDSNLYDYKADVGSVVEPTLSLVWTDVILAIFKGLYLVIYIKLALIFPVKLKGYWELYLCKNPSRRNMHVYPAKSLRFESTDFASVMLVDVGCSRRHHCPLVCFVMNTI